MPLDGTLYEDETLRVLRNAQERIRDPEHWCQHILKRFNGQVKQYCALGAILCFGWNEPEKAAEILLNCAATEMGYKRLHDGRSALVHLNNSSDHDTVKLMFARAIDLRRAEIMEMVEAA